MKTPAELAADHTELDVASLDHLQRLLGSWGVLSDLSFSDLLLLAPVRGSAGSKLIVLGQIRPTTWATLLRVDLVGQMVEQLGLARGHRGARKRGPCRRGWRDPRPGPGPALASGGP